MTRAARDGGSGSPEGGGRERRHPRERGAEGPGGPASGRTLVKIPAREGRGDTEGGAARHGEKEDRVALGNALVRRRGMLGLGQLTERGLRGAGAPLWDGRGIGGRCGARARISGAAPLTMGLTGADGDLTPSLSRSVVDARRSAGECDSI